MPDPTRLCQGDILADLTISFVAVDGELDQIPYDFMIIISQDCDLQQDYDAREAAVNPGYNNDKYIENILACPGFVSEKLKEGIHLNNLSLQMQRQNRDLWRPIISNNNPRYHYLAGWEDASLPPITLDFKRYHAIQRDAMYAFKSKRVAALDSLHSTALTHRFSYYLSRVALPELPTTE